MGCRRKLVGNLPKTEVAPPAIRVLQFTLKSAAVLVVNSANPTVLERHATPAPVACMPGLPLPLSPLAELS